MKYISSVLIGGIGNNLFQIAAGYALSLNHKRDYICSTKEIHHTHNPLTCYRNNILRNIKFFDDSLPFEMYQEINFEYKEINPTHNNLKIYGYFQSEKYFENYKNEIIDLFKIDDDTKIKLYEKYNDIINNENTCSVHIRRGDYVNLQNYHPLQSIDYYKSAFSKLNKDTHYIIFSDDLNWCKDNFKFLSNVQFIDGNKDYEDLYLMSLCKNNIIANSSFSWWGAWLNQNKNKVVISPKLWFGPSFSDKNTNDVYCKNWLIL
jgi:hypothetical protein